MSIIGGIQIAHSPGNFRRQSTVLLWCALLIAGAVLVFGWGFKIDALVRVRSSYPAMMSATALCLIVAAAGSLSFLSLHEPLWPMACGLLIVAIVSLEHLTGIGHGAYSLGGAICWASVLGPLLVAAALAAQSWPGPRARWLTTRLDTLGLSLSCLPLLGYLFDSEALWSNIIYTKTAPHTAICLCMIFMARLMLRADQNWVGVLYASERGSQMGRRILPVVILGPIALSTLALEATRRDIVTADFRLIVLAFLTITLGTYIVVTVADRINRLERNARKYAEDLKQRDIEAIRSQKITVLGRLAGGVAHDFNNLLTVIIGNLELLEEDNDIANRGFYKEQALLAANNAAVLTGQLLTYGRRSRLDPVPVMLDMSVAETVRMFQRVAGVNLEVIVDLNLPGHQSLLDPANFQQVLLNILINARDAMPQGGRIMVETGKVHSVPPALIALHDEGPLPDRTYLTVTVRDTGTGMSPEVLERALEPYFTTKGVGEGSGLGLSMAQGFCRQSLGDLRIRSTPGQGTTIILYFPMFGLMPSPAPAAHKIPSPKASAPARILIVDDEVGVAAVMARQLTRHGYAVMTARDGSKALALLEAGPLPDLVITDVIMPGVWQGHQLAARIHERWPQVLVLLMSGYQPNSLRDQFTFAREIVFLQKPINQARLLDTVAKLLAGA